VPEDLKLKGKRERFTIQATYDTLDLYGKVQAVRPVFIVRD
jgi:hypothetical protein